MFALFSNFTFHNLGQRGKLMFDLQAHLTVDERLEQAGLL
jgi:hypothetical protein